MKKTFFIILFTLLTGFTSLKTMAQSLQQQKTDSLFQLVKKQFNARQADSIYEFAGDNFQRNISADKFRDIVTQNLFPLGAIKQSSLISFVNNRIATYKLVFGSVTLQLLMNLDDKDKLDLFLFQPYKETSAQKLTIEASSNPLRSDMDRKVDTVARPYIQKANTVGLSIGILKNGKITTYDYGETTLGNGRLPTANNLFEIGSITKTFTATLLAYYINEGKVKLSDSITKYLPDSVAANPALKAITMVTLSNHTSGLPSLPDNLNLQTADPLNPYKAYTKQLLFTYLRTCKLNSVPGEKYAYSNLAVGLLGTILEHISGKTYSEMVAGIITKPLGMASTVQYISPALKPRFVTVYNEDGKVTPPWDFDVLAPCGALRSTVNDLLKYARANMVKGPGSLSKAFDLTHQITFNKDVKLGLGWHIITVNDVEYYFHDGDTGGSSSFLAFNIEKDMAIVILSNSVESTAAVGVNILKKLQ